MEDVIREALCESSGKIFKQNDTISSMLCVPGLIFLKHMTHVYDKLLEELHTVSEDVKEKVLIIPSNAGWEYILEKAYSSDIGTYLDEAMQAIGTVNKSFQSILPQEYSSRNINGRELSKFINMLGEIPADHCRTNEILRHSFDYIIRRKLSFVSQTGIYLKETFHAPKCVEKLMVAMAGPKEGKIFDPCCRFGSLLVESKNFIKENRHSFNEVNVKFYGQESIFSFYRLCCMHLAMHGIDIDHVKWNSESSLHRDRHRELKADIILGVPSYNSSVYPWIDYVLSHLSRKGRAVLLISKNSLLIKNGKEYRFDKKCLEQNCLDCIISLPGTLFPMAGISACILIVAKNRGVKKGKYRYRRNEILFIDAAPLIKGKNARNKELCMNDINEIASTYHQWREKQGGYMDKKEYCKILNTSDNTSLRTVV